MATTEEEPFLLDRRRVPREAILQGAEIMIGDEVQACRLLDLNACGARLELSGAQGLPERFALRLPGGPQVMCARRWSSGLRLGVEFVPGVVSGGHRLERARALLRTMDAMQAEQLFAALRRDALFDDPAIAEAARALKSALDQLDGALRAFIQGTEDARHTAPGASPPPRGLAR